MREEEYTNSLLTDVLEIHFIEFPKFKKLKANLKDDLESWLLFIENPTEEVLSMLKDNKEIQNAKSVLEYLEQDEEAMRLYELREKAIHDYVSNIEGAKEEGMQKGIQKGIQLGKKEGEKEGIQLVAKNLLEKNVDIKMIKAVTGLTEEEIKNLI